MTIVRVGLDVPVDQLFDYRCDVASDADIGTRVLVPFGKRDAIGVILEVADATDIPLRQLKTVKRILRDAPAFSADDLRLLRFAAEYYHYPWGAAVLATLPVRLRRVGTPATSPTHFAITMSGEAMRVEDLPARAVVRRRLLALFQNAKRLDQATVKSLAATAPAALRDFVVHGWVQSAEGAITPADNAQKAPHIHMTPPPPLTSEQQRAVVHLHAHLDGFHPTLLLGVTGSGKTEVYLHVIKEILARGRQILLLVPEIALTPQLEATVRTRFPDVATVSLHSGLNETERLQHWLAAQSGRARIVLGTRLAVFAPLPALGLIVVDEEQDASLRQSEGFRYSARDLAVVRAQQRNVPLVLGSATPALETYFNAASSRYALIKLGQRINAELPQIACVNTRDIKLDNGLSPALITAIGERLARSEQSLVFINRRGYAPVLMCHDCGWLSGCHRCSAKLVLHLRDRRLHCHHCGYQTPVPLACPDCGNAALAPVGHGTQRVEAGLASVFPQARILRIDRDSTRRRDAWRGMRGKIEAREVDILVGTQILAKGHDFLHLNLVGVINADSLLYSTDFRAPERLYALLTQVAGRAGRGATRGEVLIQTDFPSHPLYAALREQDYAAFAQNLLTERRQAGFPPFVFQALLRAEAPKLETATTWLAHAADAGRALNNPAVSVYEPVPASLTRLAGRERAQLLVQSSHRGALQKFLAQWHEHLHTGKSRSVRWAIDVDPLEL